MRSTQTFSVNIPTLFTTPDDPVLQTYSKDFDEYQEEEVQRIEPVPVPEEVENEENLENTEDDTIVPEIIYENSFPVCDRDLLDMNFRIRYLNRDYPFIHNATYCFPTLDFSVDGAVVTVNNNEYLLRIFDEDAVLADYPDIDDIVTEIEEIGDAPERYHFYVCSQI